MKTEKEEKNKTTGVSTYHPSSYQFYKKTIAILFRIAKSIVKSSCFAVAVFLFIIYAMLLTPATQYVRNIRNAYQSYCISIDGISEMWSQTRYYLGKFRSPPSDEEMIKHFVQNREAFDHLVSNYYKDVAVTKSFTKTSSNLSKLFRATGIWRADMEGPYLAVDKSADVLVNHGISFYLTDHGPSPWWSLGQRTYKAYVFIPESNIGHPPLSPSDSLLATGEFEKEENTGEPKRKIKRGYCAFRAIERNWFIARCDEHNASW